MLCVQVKVKTRDVARQLISVRRTRASSNLGYAQAWEIQNKKGGKSKSYLLCNTPARARVRAPTLREPRPLGAGAS